jgi:beta-xylosidase
MVSNPIVPGFNPDPSLIRVGSDYFLATSTFEYFPGVAIHHSTDLVNWKIIGHALNRPSQLNMRNVCPGAGIYAPTLRHWKGRFYMATSVVYDRPGGGVRFSLSSWDNRTDRCSTKSQGGSMFRPTISSMTPSGLSLSTLRCSVSTRM